MREVVDAQLPGAPREGGVKPAAAGPDARLGAQPSLPPQPHLKLEAIFRLHWGRGHHARVVDQYGQLLTAVKEHSRCGADRSQVRQVQLQEVDGWGAGHRIPDSQEVETSEKRVSQNIAQ